MDDRTSKKKSPYLVCRVLLDHRLYRLVVPGLLLILFSLPLAASGSSSDSTYDPYPCDTTLEGRVKCAVWYDSGKLHIVKTYRNGRRHGTWSYYFPGGELEKRVKYKRGKLIYIFFYEDDKVYKTIDKNGKVRYRKRCDCL